MDQHNQVKRDLLEFDGGWVHREECCALNATELKWLPPKKNQKQFYPNELEKMLLIIEICLTREATLFAAGYWNKWWQKSSRRTNKLDWLTAFATAETTCFVRASILSWLTAFLFIFHWGIATSFFSSFFLPRISKYDGIPVLVSISFCSGCLLATLSAGMLVWSIWKGSRLAKLDREKSKEGVLVLINSANREVTVFNWEVTLVVDSLLSAIVSPLDVTISPLMLGCEEDPRFCNLNLLNRTESKNVWIRSVSSTTNAILTCEMNKADIFLMVSSKKLFFARIQKSL